MVGTWGWQNPGESEVDCVHSITYYANGRYEFMDEVGYWRIDGKRLTETMVEAGGTGDPKTRGKPVVRLFKIVRPGFIRLLGKYPGNMRRCANK